MKGSVNVPGVSVVDLRKNANEQTPTFTQAETLENISSGEKMSTLMGKIMKAIAELISHLKNGNHVPATQTANNATFLRNDNTWQKVTPENIGAAASSHGTHVTYSTTAPVMDGTASVGTADTVARSDHKHPTDSSRAPAPIISRTDITAGSTALATGQSYHVYE